MWLRSILINVKDEHNNKADALHFSWKHDLIKYNSNHDATKSRISLWSLCAARFIQSETRKLFA